ncbi:Prp18-domain-containing protein [Stereum hirsutum FP-91666 SS1]|uniref:Prp18-domain-containing protein n=1 Tax=Stereum hirsutum (strain FP-91666) TaxID=721885 RepID=UPI000440E439|nr:Prp18-domain-containing protein [Stereum hirsutum FP-91666 SS1]EIM90854.1 Prp18-domain-containing protein [Stereum hirsutum FP-91666 SS1]
MDALKAEIASKRKALDEVPVRPNKYMRRGDLERLNKEEEERKAREKQAAERERLEKEKAEQATASASKSKPGQASKASTRSLTASPHPDGFRGPSNSPQPEAAAAAFNISNEETVRRLRAKSQPIRLFGESDKERRLRLRALELIEEKGHDKAGGNDFRKALEDVEKSERELKATEGGGDSGKGKKKGSGVDSGESVLDLELLKTDPDRLYPIIYYALKRALKEWEESLTDRPDNIKRSTQGKLAAATQVQSAEYLKPLFKLIRSRSLPPDMLARISEIVHHMQKRQYQRANDSYLRLSIGNAPWPIGVTMVGIHERSAREKISSDQVAHVLNDEVSRKYIQSLKRLLTFAQTKYPPEDVSQLMG